MPEKNISTSVLQVIMFVFRKIFYWTFFPNREQAIKKGMDQALVRLKELKDKGEMPANLANSDIPELSTIGVEENITKNFVLSNESIPVGSEVEVEEPEVGTFFEEVEEPEVSRNQFHEKFRENDFTDNCTSFEEVEELEIGTSFEEVEEPEVGAFEEVEDPFSKALEFKLQLHGSQKTRGYETNQFHEIFFFYIFHNIFNF